MQNETAPAAGHEDGLRCMFIRSYENETDRCIRPWKGRFCGGSGALQRSLPGQRCGRLTLIANSIGAYFSLLSLDETLVDAAYLISPVVDMEKLIGRMMTWANVTERELAERQEIPTTFGETLSWRYLCDVREHPVTWRVPTRILYGERDELTDMRTITEFAEKSGAALTVMPGGEHWFHTDEQLRFLDRWISA